MAKLVQPISRGETKITDVALRMPDTGALRGLKLTNVLQMDVNTMQVLIPRISEPALLPDEVAALSPANLLLLSDEVVSFFMNPADLRAAEDVAKLN